MIDQSLGMFFRPVWLVSKAQLSLSSSLFSHTSSPLVMESSFQASSQRRSSA